MPESRFIRFVKNWLLVIGIVTGACAYLLYHAIPALHPAGPVLEVICRKLQPVLLFLMLFLSFCKIEPRDLKPHRWQAWLLLIQGGLFALFGLALAWAAHNQGTGAGAWIWDNHIILESTMLCLICPTATACAVMTGKLGGNMAEVVTYTIIINLLVAVAVPLVVPLIYPENGLSFFAAFLRILSKVFPLLILPYLAAWFIRRFLPKFHGWLLGQIHWSFYIWGFSLTLAILMSTRAIVHFDGSSWVLAGIGISSLAACIFQFWAGRKIGKKYGCEISASQALGQKNTVFSIWMGYTFLEPVVSVAGGFYSIWHNVWNSWQLYRKRLRDEAAAAMHNE